MQQTHLTIDGALGGRLSAYRQILLHAEGQPDQAPLVRIPGQEPLTLSVVPGEGLRAAGMLLAYALLGREDPGAEALMQSMEQRVAERQLRRLCTLSLSMMQDEAAFSLPSLLACLRTAIAFLPEGDGAEPLPGLVQEAETPPMTEETIISARFAFAEDAAIAYFTLPEGCKKAVIDGKTYPAAQCSAGICLSPGATRVSVLLGNQTATLQVADPWQNLRLSVLFQLGPVFAKASGIPRGLWKKLPVWVCVSGWEKAQVPALRLITSRGEIAHEAALIPKEGVLRLRCPGLDPQMDSCVQLCAAGTRYIDIYGED